MQLLDLPLIGLQQAQGLLRRPLGEIGVGVSQERLLRLLEKPCSRDGRIPCVLAWMLRAAYAHDHVLLHHLARIPEGGSLAEQNCGEKPPHDPAQTVSEVQ